MVIQARQDCKGTGAGWCLEEFFGNVGYLRLMAVWRIVIYEAKTSCDSVYLVCLIGKIEARERGGISGPSPRGASTAWLGDRKSGLLERASLQCSFRAYRPEVPMFY